MRIRQSREDRTIQRLVCVAAAGSIIWVTACTRRVPERPGVAPGTPHVSWVIMSGDRDNPDQEFVCQSEPRNDCVVSASRPGAPVFGHVHVYYHGSGAETRYEGTMKVGFFEGSASSITAPVNVDVKKDESIANSSVTGVVTAAPGAYAVTFELTAQVMDGRTESIHESVPVVVN